MSEEATPKKKGGKLPIILALVLMLAGGGFFVMKPKPKAIPEVELGEAEIVLPDDFVVNLADGRSFLQCKIGLRPAKGFMAEEVTKHDAEVSDAIIGILKSVKPAQAVSERDIKSLKKRIASALNKILKPEEKEEESKTSGKKKSKKSEEAGNKIEEGEIPEDWDSAKGPILKVFFKTFVTQ